MSDPRDALRDALAAALRAHCSGAGEAALGQAYDAARRALAAGLGLLDLDAAHQAATDDVVAEVANPAEVPGVRRAAGELRHESLTPFEMALRGYRDANTTLQQLNATLEARAAELAAAHDALQANYAVIEQQRNALVEAERQKAQLTAFVVHDLKNPLSGIVLNATVVARDRSLSDEPRHAAQSVLQSAHAMNRMVMNLLDISRSEDGALVPRRAAVDLVALLDEVARTMRVRLGDAGPQLATSTQLAHRTVSADVDLLRRVLENLIDNAIRYSPRGGTITLEAVDGPDAGVEIRVRDEGAGVPAEHRERIFDKYVQLEAGAGTSLRTGRGLGLVFCRLAVEAHGGKIWIEAGTPTGSVFCVRLPAT